jgi:hypothetical protein
LSVAFDLDFAVVFDLNFASAFDLDFAVVLHLVLGGAAVHRCDNQLVPESRL